MNLIEKWIEGQGSPHLFIVGGTGAGKTTFARMLALYLLRKHMRGCVVDFDGEYADLPLRQITPKFKVTIPSSAHAYLGWLLSQSARPEEGGYATAALMDFFEDNDNLDEIFAKVKHDLTLPSNVRYAILWRVKIFQKYFEIVRENSYDDILNSRFDLSEILSIRERQLVQQILVSYIVDRVPTLKWIVIEEARPSPWITDVSMIARRKGKKLIFMSQFLPEDVQNYELVIFTPYPARQIPLPVNPFMDRGIWWVGRLGTYRLKHLW
jgi:energy-coupling factor transporter ATP-binding protein EcfA2